MRNHWTKGWLLAAALGGLCLPAGANTTAAPAEVQLGSVSAPTPIERVPLPVITRIALLLPLQSPTLGQAADAVRAGFVAAHERDGDDILVSVIETGDAPDDIVESYSAALAQADMVVGPLSRSGVTALAQSGALRKPTIALTQPDGDTDAEAALPRQMLAVGLSIEDEARQAAAWAAAERRSGKAIVVAGNAAWQRRAAKAFIEQWERQGLAAEALDLTVFSGYLSAKGLADLKERVQQSDQKVVLFAALDARQAGQVRGAVGAGIPLYGTSQLNPFAQPAADGAVRNAMMEGARLLDIPWQVQPDHPAVMSYPRFAGPEQASGADLERLYALGIDAYRVAREIALKHTSFELDGVTGRLTVRFGAAAPFFARAAQHATYRDGSVVAIGTPR